jgi:hypothetical protein
MTNPTKEDLRCNLAVSARWSCADILGATHLLYYTHTDDTYEVYRIRAALTDLTAAFNAAYPEIAGRTP